MFVACSQIGFSQSAPKFVTVTDAGEAEFVLLDGHGSEVCRGNLGSATVWDAWNKPARLVDLSAITHCGRYLLKIPRYGVEQMLEIVDSPWKELGRMLIRAFYFQRASIQIDAQYGGKYERPFAHDDLDVRIHSSASSLERPEDFSISSPKGWYDAGDYNKYVVNSGITVWTLLQLYEDFPDYLNHLDLNIPESGSGFPDLLSEVKWNLDWMLAMQDPNDGGVYHKLTNLVFDGMVPPHQCTSPRFVVMKSTAAALHFSAVLAKTARIFKRLDLAYSEKCLSASKRAYQWAQENPAVYFQQPLDVRTGRYEDDQLQDELQFASIELHLATADSRYLEIADSLRDLRYDVPNWRSVATLGAISMARTQRTPWACEIIRNLADELVNRQSANPFHNSMAESDFCWGSNGVCANQGLVLVQAYLLFQEEKYRNAAVPCLEYLVGYNPLNQSYVTGVGTKAPFNPHHRISASDSVPEPVPGLLVGGANAAMQDAHRCPPYGDGSASTAYLDDVRSYASNEIAINWNAPAAYLANALHCLFSVERL